MIKHRAQDKNERGLSVMEKLKLDFYYGREAEQFTFYRLPKALITDACFKGMTNNAKLLYGLMLDRMSLSKKRGWLDEANKVFIKYSLNNVEEDLNVSRKTASSLLKELEEIGRIISADLGSEAINSSFFSPEIIKASLNPVFMP